VRKAIYTYTLDRQWVTATSAVTSSYFRFATVTLNFICNELSHTAGVPIP